MNAVRGAAGRVYAIALNTFREAIRQKVLWGIGFAVVVVMVFAFAVSEMSLHEEARVARDVGLAGIAFFGMVTAVVLGVVLLYSEIEKKTIHTILAKPIERHEFVVGKYLGMSATLVLVVVGFALMLAGLLAVRGVAFDGRVLRAVILHGLALEVIAATAVFFSSFSTPFLSGIFAFFIWALGLMTDDIAYAMHKWKDPVLRGLVWVGLKLVPDLHVFMVSGSELDGKWVSVNGDFVGWGYLAHAALYAGLWVSMLLLFASLIFRRRDFV